MSLGTNTKFLKLGMVENVKIPNFDIPTMKEVVARLDELKEHCSALEENYTKTIALCDDMKQALLKKHLTENCRTLNSNDMSKETLKTNIFTLIKIGAPIPFAFWSTHIPKIEEWCTCTIQNQPSITFYVILGFLALIWAFVVLIYRKTNSDKKTQDELVKSQQDLTKTQEELVKSQQELSEALKPTMVDCSVGSLKACVIHHRTLKTWDRIREAKEEIILHAAYYPKYGYDSDYSTAFMALMRNKHTVNVTVIITDISSQWAEEFGKILRYEYDTIERFEEGISSSIAFFKKLKEEFPNRVTIKTSSRLPLMPFVIIDNDILVGHYCHAEIPAPNGLWLHINSEKVTEIIEKVRYESTENRKAYIANLTDEEQAISRYIEDVFDAIKHGKTI